MSLIFCCFPLPYTFQARVLSSVETSLRLCIEGEKGAEAERDGKKAELPWVGGRVRGPGFWVKCPGHGCGEA